MASRGFRLAAGFIRRLPFYLLALKGAWVTLYSFGISINDYWFISELQAHSVAFVAVLAFYAYVNRSCLYLWVCIFALLGLNVLNIAHYFLYFAYLYNYSALLIIAGLTFSIIAWKQQSKRKA